MDKLYKPHFLSQLKARMPLERPDFIAQKIPKDHPLRSQFSGSLLYLRQLPSQHCVWLVWFPAEGVEREFFTQIGWSLAPDILPMNQPGDPRMRSFREPTARLDTGVLNIQAVEGRQAISGFKIATPWDQLYALGPRTPDAERKRVMNKAYAEYLAVTEAQRIDAVRIALNEAFSCVANVLPRFAAALEQLKIGEA